MPIQPKPAAIGEVAWLEITSVDRRGALLEGGLPQPVLLPRNQAVGPVRVGQWCLVWVDLDEQRRPVATMHLNDFVADESDGMTAGDRVSLVIGHKSPLGVNAVVNHAFWGLLHTADLFQAVRMGQRLDGWVKQVREDGKLDLTLREPGYAAVDSLTDRILGQLKAADGFLPLTDNSEPVAIRRVFGVSKKQFKQALGALYKRRRISLEADGIRLVPGTEGQ